MSYVKFLGLLAAAALLASFSGASCGNTSRQAVESFYCLPGYHLENGQCLPDSIDGEKPDPGTDGDADSDPDFDLDPDPDADSDADLDAADGNRPESEEDRDRNDTPEIADDESSSETVADRDIAGGELILTAPDVLAVGARSGLRAILLTDNGGQQTDVGDEAVFTCFNLDIAEVNAQTGQPAELRGLAEGEATLRAAYGDWISDPAIVRVRPRARVEARGLWVNRWSFASPEDVRTIMADAAAARFNQVYFQVRGDFDAYYASNLEPWARGLSGSLGTDPGWDPLETAVEAAHGHGLELHAWINAFTLWSGSSPPPETVPRHMYLEHPEWIMQDENQVPMALGSGYVWASPGNSELRAHNVAVALDIAARYDVDGIHLDRIRYPGPDYSHDAASIQAFVEAKVLRPELTYADWEREQVVAQVAQIRIALESHAPRVVLSAAVAGIYQDEWDWGGVTEGYHQWLQNSRAMVDQGALDVLIPMVYWRCLDTYGGWTDFCALVDSHAAHTENRFLYIGSDLDAGGDAEKRTRGRQRGFESFEEIQEQIGKTRQADTEGWVLYDYNTVKSAGYLESLAAGPFAETAEVPFIWWK